MKGKLHPFNLCNIKLKNRARTDEELEAHESGILIVNEEETPKEYDELKGNRGSERRRKFT